jgi:uncharacterized protein
VILIDANILLYAYDGDAKEHIQARSWVEERFSDPESVGLAWVTILAFLRIATSKRYESAPMSTAEASSIVDGWLELGNIALTSPTDRHWSILNDLLPKSQARGPLIMDAHLAALAIEHGATLCTTDRDFVRFPGLKVEFPLQ